MNGDVGSGEARDGEKDKRPGVLGARRSPKFDDKMTYFQNVKVEKNLIDEVFLENWGGKLEKLVKASQNHTFLGKIDETDVVVRVTPDLNGKRCDSFDLEARFLDYLKENGLEVCGVIKSRDGKWMIYKDGLCIMVFEFAKGDAVVLGEWKWMEKDHVETLGRWIGRLHVLSRGFTEGRDGLRQWYEIHDGILKDAPLDERDLKALKDKTKSGIIHGDVNISNYFYGEDGVCMFDWDQMQEGWYLYDLASPIWTVWTMKGGGNPVDGSPVPQANPEEFMGYLVKGYEEVTSEKVDLEGLKRMIELRRYLYKEFCSKALGQVEEDSEMGKFMRYMLGWL